MTPDQSRALARWLFTLPLAEASAIKARFATADDEWRTLSPAEQEAAMRAWRDRPAPRPATRP